MKCWNCNAELEEGSLFCPDCGKEQTWSEGKKCPFCGNALEDDAVFCTSCGNRIPSEEILQKETRKEIPGKEKKGKKLFFAGTAVCLLLVETAGILKVTDGLKNLSLKQEESEKQVEKYVDDEAVDKKTADDQETKIQENAEAENISYEDAIDAVHNERVAFEGTVFEDGFLILEEEVDVCARAEEDMPMRMNQVYYLKLQGDSFENFVFYDEIGAEIRVEGTVHFAENVPMLQVLHLEILKEAVQEDEIHRYEVFVEDCTWQEAYEKCREKGGYLVRINSEEEFKQIVKVIKKNKNYDKKQYYIGMRRDTGSDAYYLVDEENQFMGERMDHGYTPWAESLWLEDEPSYRDETLQVDETAVSIFRHRDLKRWVINDIPSELVVQIPSYQGKVGYICEYPE